MKVINLLQINDLNMKSFLRIILVIQFAIFGAIGLDVVGLQIPILQQLIGFIYLAFVPGILILRVLKLHKLGNIRTILYSVGLSIATLMFSGSLVNMLYPFFGISRPISITPLISTISILVLILCILSYVRDKDFSDPIFIDVRDVLSTPALFLCLIPFLAIFGTYLVNFYHTNILLLFLILVIAGIVILVTFEKFIQRKLYPLAIFVIAVALLWHASLISMYLTGYDIHLEYYFGELVKEGSHWDWMISDAYNAMLSTTILPAVYSSILNIDVAWVFKIIYPIFFSLVPLGLYEVYQKQTDERKAFLAGFFFISLAAFYGLMISSAKQQIALLFFVLLILLMVDREVNATKTAIMMIIFSASLIVSHYGTSYIYMFYIAFTWLLLSFMDNTTVNNFKQKLHARFNKHEKGRMFSPDDDAITNMERPLLKDTRIIAKTFVVLCFVMALSWYFYVSNSVTFVSIVNLFSHIYTNMGDMFNPATRDPNVLKALGLKQTASFEHDITRFLFLITVFFIIIGVIKQIKYKEMEFKREYMVMTIASIILMLMCILLPYFASSFATSRFYIISLLFLSPFCILGGETVFGKILKLFRLVSWRLRPRACIFGQRSYSDKDQKRQRNTTLSKNKIYAFLVLIVLIPYFLFNTGFIYEVTRDIAPTSISLSMERLKGSNEEMVKVAFRSEYTCEQDVFGAKWLSKYEKDRLEVYADLHRSWYVLNSYGRLWGRVRVISQGMTMPTKETYTYLSYLNVVDGLMVGGGAYYNITEISAFLGRNCKIYSNGGSEIYYYE